MSKQDRVEELVRRCKQAEAKLFRPDELDRKARELLEERQGEGGT